ncbi:MAG: HAD-IIA family hydrolase [Ktedonobacterales bacterium]|nr:HAD-IIA family hydrolase [Ktedonobacterales bacterium]
MMKDYRSYLLDLDGVVYRGAALLPGARDFIAWLEATGRDYRYLTNNSMQSPADVATRLRSLGIPTPEARVVTASQAAVALFAERWPGQPIWVVGLPSLRQMAAAAGLRVLNLTEGAAPDDPDAGPTTARAVLVGLHRSLIYADLQAATRAVLAGAELWGVNRDPQLPMEDGFDPGCGAILAALEVATGHRANIVGKPAPAMLLTTLHAMGADPATAVMVGDGLAMDIAAGQAAGIDTILLLSGLTDAAQAAVAVQPPTLIFRDLADLLHSARG